jgi:hypothetical protein
MALMRPYQQIVEGLKCNADLACGNYAAIYHYLATSAGLANRAVTYRGHAGDWEYAMHYYNEVYLREEDQWAMVDALEKIIFPHDVKGNYFNAVDVKKMSDINGFSGKYVFLYRDSSIIEMPYDSVKEKHIYFNNNNANLCFIYPGADVRQSAWRNFADFYTFKRNDDFYNDVNRNDWYKIIVKEFFAIALLLCITCFLANRIRFLVKSSRN